MFFAWRCVFFGKQGAFLSRWGTFRATRVKHSNMMALDIACVRTLNRDSHSKTRCHFLSWVFYNWVHLLSNLNWVGEACLFRVLFQKASGVSMQ